MPGRCVPQCKGKSTTIPKPARGSGLNPSGLLIADQLYLPAEQPLDFDPYGQSMQGWPGYGDKQGPSFYGNSALFGGTQGTSSSGDALGVLSLGAVQDQGPSFSDNAPGPLSFSDT
ncbi:hypothetical protein P692DRAFT_20875281 [Suillus brevipes Sb2]|nr:hypothetical protein P692DRAFT_20875281 [Suillus brevipes Sb2]